MYSSSLYLLLQAVASYSKALETCPNDDAVLVNRAISYVVLGDSDRSLADLNTASKYYS